MFNYTNEIIINAANDCTKVDSGVFSIYRNGNFTVANMSYVKHADGSVVTSKMVKTPYAAPAFGSIDLAGAVGTAGDIVRVYFKIACSSKYAEFAMANWGAFEKPVMVEFLSTGAVAPLVAALKQVLEPEVATVSDAGKVTLVESCFSIVPESVKVVKVEYTCDDCSGFSDESETVLTAFDTLDKVKALIEAASEGKGTYEYLIQNLRYPTRENLRYAAPNADEMPIKGVEYDEYNFDYTVKRSNPAGGLSAVGQEVTSTVHITLFVNNAITIDGLDAIADEHADA